MSEINWHALPGELPQKSGLYLVTRKHRETGKVALFLDGYAALSFLPQDPEHPYFICEKDCEKEWTTIAWANLPEPYRPPEPEDSHPDAETARAYVAGDPETLRRLSIFD